MNITLNDTSKEVEVDISVKPKIVLPVDIYQELSEYVKLFDGECSGCGIVEVKDYVYTITKIFLPNQTNSSASTDIGEQVVSDLLVKLVECNEEVAKLKLHWHSHATMGVFHSGTDEGNYQTLLGSDYLVSLVLNKAGDVLGRIDYSEPFKCSISNIPVVLEVPVESKEVEKLAKKNFDKVKKYESKVEKSKVKDVSVIGEWRGHCDGNGYGYDYNYAGYPVDELSIPINYATTPSFVEGLMILEESGLIKLTRDNLDEIIGFTDIKSSKTYELSITGGIPTKELEALYD